MLYVLMDVEYAGRENQLVQTAWSSSYQPELAQKNHPKGNLLYWNDYSGKVVWDKLHQIIP